jgi:hypothetical protein
VWKILFQVFSTAFLTNSSSGPSFFYCISCLWASMAPLLWKAPWRRADAVITRSDGVAVSMSSGARLQCFAIELGLISVLIHSC